MKILTGIIGTVFVCLGAALAVSLSSSTVAQSQFAGQWIIEFDSINPFRAASSSRCATKPKVAGTATTLT